jgi:transcriptional regulator with XRE-family HTH domain
MELAARQLMRAIRGSRSQIAFCRRLGYRTNVATDWESGRRFPDAAEALRAAAVAGIDVPAALRAFHAPSAEAYVAGGVAAWLSALRGSTPHAFLADAAGASRHQVGRWLRGDATPRLPQLLAVVDACTGRMPDLVAALVDVSRVPAVAAAAEARRRAGRLLYDAPWSPAVLTLLATATSGTLAAIAERVGASPADLAPAVDALVDAGLVVRDGEALRAVGPLTSAGQGSPDDRYRVRVHWADAARRRLDARDPRDRFGLDVFAVSRADHDRIRERYAAFYREVRAIVAASEPVETAGLLVVQLVEWGALDSPAQVRPAPAVGTEERPPELR